jgi:succinyl-CoA synthetase beta subunit
MIKVCYSFSTRGFNGPVIIASSVGGTDIENVAEKTPHLIKTIPVDILIGVTHSMAESVADFLQFEGSLKAKVVICTKLIEATVCYNKYIFLEVINILA